MSVCMSAVSAGISEVLIKYTGKYVKIYFIMKITFFWSFGHHLFFDFACVPFSGYHLYTLDYALTTCSSAMDLRSCYTCGFVISG